MTHEEKLIWNDIAERNLANTISLNSGIRTPKSFIEKDIKAFKDLKQTEKSELLRALIKAPNNPSNPCELTLPSENVSSELNLSHYACLDGEKVQPDSIVRLLDDCPAEVCQIRNSTSLPVRIHEIFKQNHHLLFKYMIIFKQKFGLRKTLTSVYSKLQQSKTYR